MFNFNHPIKSINKELSKIGYEIYKSEEGSYCIKELYDLEFNAWRTCAEYFKKSDVVEYANKLLIK